MNRRFDRRKNICKNPGLKRVKKHIYTDRHKKPFASAFWRRRHIRDSDKESSHVVGKPPQSGGRQR